jgi:hypothetical protein
MPSTSGTHPATLPPHQGQCHRRSAVVVNSGRVRDDGSGGRRRQQEMPGSDKALHGATHKRDNRTCSGELRMIGLMWFPIVCFSRDRFVNSGSSVIRFPGYSGCNGGDSGIVNLVRSGHQFILSITVDGG